MFSASTLQLGLIGDNIAQSLSPRLHRLAGAQNGLSVTYDRLVPAELGMSLKQVFQHCRNTGYRGINVTYPYKEAVVEMLRIDDPLVRAIGATNTVVFEVDGAVGYNTDYSGFIAAYRAARGEAETGPVLLIGTGGVGRAVAFGLAALGTKDLCLMDRDISKAKELATALKTAAPDVNITTADTLDTCATGAAGLINCTPVGMVGSEGTPLPASQMSGAAWAFDAVYTPVDTQFSSDAVQQGLQFISGWELFFHQGVHAWALFTKRPINEIQLRQDLQRTGGIQ
ncbi:MAG: shikimate dehydrogenase family protein [Marinosulfonomonas sp.]